jgi:hypothetical protein
LEFNSCSYNIALHRYLFWLGKKKVSGLKDHGESFKNLTSRDPERFWTSGQWVSFKMIFINIKIILFPIILDDRA